jgi:putative hydrolase of HD superfamily
MTNREIHELADQLTSLGSLAMAFGRVDRITYHPDGVTPESDTDHTVMLGWLACAMAARLYPNLDLGFVAQFALVHDAPEVYAGDTPTLRIDQTERAAKAGRERAAIKKLALEFDESLAWFPDTIICYEYQRLPEARFVRALDKVLPLLTDLLNCAIHLSREEMDAGEFRAMLTRQREDIKQYAGEFTALIDLHTEMTERVCNLPAMQEGLPTLQPVEVISD